MTNDPWAWGGLMFWVVAGFCASLVGSVFVVCLLDTHEAKCQRARDRGENLNRHCSNLCVGNPYQLHITDNSYDCVCQVGTHGQ